jgi:hypothetical protein
MWVIINVLQESMASIIRVKVLHHLNKTPAISPTTKQAGVIAVLQTCIEEVTDSNFGHVTDYSD